MATLGWTLRYVASWPGKLFEALPTAGKLLSCGLIVVLASARALDSWAPAAGYVALAVASWGLRRVEPVPGQPLLRRWPLAALAIAALAWLLGGVLSSRDHLVVLALWASGLSFGLARLYAAAGRDLLCIAARGLGWVFVPWAILVVLVKPDALLRPELAGVHPVFARSAEAAVLALRFGPLLAGALVLARLARAGDVIRQREARHQPDVPAQERSPRAPEPDELAPKWRVPPRFPPTRRWWFGVSALSLALALGLNSARRIDRFPAGYSAQGTWRNVRLLDERQANPSSAGPAEPAADYLLVLRDAADRLLLCGRFCVDAPGAPLRWQACQDVAELAGVSGVSPHELASLDYEAAYPNFEWGLDTFGEERIRKSSSRSQGPWSVASCEGFLVIRHQQAPGFAVVRIRAAEPLRAAEVAVYPSVETAHEGLLRGYPRREVERLLLWYW